MGKKNDEKNMNTQNVSQDNVENDISKVKQTTTPVKLADLIVKIAFTDKYDESKNYEIGHVIKADSISKERYDELLHDKRGIVAENK